MSNEALHNSFELANSKTPPLFPSKGFDNLKPLPSAIFFSILFFGSAGYFLASAPGIPLHPLRKK